MVEVTAPAQVREPIPAVVIRGNVGPDGGVAGGTEGHEGGAAQDCTQHQQAAGTPELTTLLGEGRHWIQDKMVYCKTVVTKVC